jgi:hypothetical protein
MNQTQFSNLMSIMEELPKEYLQCWARGNHRWDTIKSIPTRYGWEETDVCASCSARRTSDLNHWFRPVKRGAIDYAQPEVYRVSKHEGVDLGDATIWDLRGAAAAVLHARREAMPRGR